MKIKKKNFIEEFNMKEKTKSVELTERECTQIKACIFVATYEDEVEWLKHAGTSNEDADLRRKLDYYRNLMAKFKW